MNSSPFNVRVGRLSLWGVAGDVAVMLQGCSDLFKNRNGRGGVSGPTSLQARTIPRPRASISSSRAVSTSSVARFGRWPKLHLRRFGLGLVGRPSLTRRLVVVRSLPSGLSMMVVTVRRLSASLGDPADRAAVLVIGQRLRLLRLAGGNRTAYGTLVAAQVIVSCSSSLCLLTSLLYSATSLSRCRSARCAA